MSYSGPASSYGVVGRLFDAYFKSVNEGGGVAGRKIEFLSLDDGYSPPKTVEATRRLVEQDNVAFIFHSMGTPTNMAVRRYLNDRKVPQVFAGTGDPSFSDGKSFPWSSGWPLNYRVEARIYASYLQQVMPHAKIAILWQNDSFGKDYVEGIRDVLGADFDRRVVRSLSYNISDPSIDSQILELRASGADVLITAAAVKFVILELRKMHELNWKPLHLITNTASSVSAVLKPAGPEKAIGLITGAINKDPNDPRWRSDAGMKEYMDFMARYMPNADASDLLYVYSYGSVKALMQALRRCNGDFSRENILKQVTALRDVEIPTLLPGIKVNTTPARPSPLNSLQLQRWDGEVWVPFGPVIEAPV